MEKDCGMWINVLSRKLKKRMNANMQSLGITGVQSRVMHYILVKCVDGPVFQRDVESAFGLSRSTATGILQLMEKNGLILREREASDARLKVLTPTAKAAHLDAQVDEYLHQCAVTPGGAPWVSSVLRTVCQACSWRCFWKPPHICPRIWIDSRRLGPYVLQASLCVRMMWLRISAQG